MHQLEDVEVPRGHHRRSLDGREGSPRPSGFPVRRAGSEVRLRVVRVPGGFAYVADRPVRERS